MTTAIERKKELEDEILKAFDGWSHVKELIAYKYLHAKNCSLDKIDYEIDQALRKEAKEKSECS